VIDSNRKILRFSNAIANLGIGPLELRGDMDPRTRNIKVMQHISMTDGSVLTAPVGQFYFHDSHNHWHWDGFSLYQVWTIDQNGLLLELLYSSDKVGYCLRDDALAESFWDETAQYQKAESGERFYLSCGWQRQGLSIGWTDVYRHNTPGQFVDISGLEDGIYALRSITDPEMVIYEMDKGGNDRVVYFQLQGNRVSLVDLFTA
jgi:hypothetical protein